MAEGDDIKCPQSINTEESDDLTKVVVTLVIPNMTVEKKFRCSAKPKTGECEVDVKFDAQSFEVNASVKKKAKITKYHYRCNKLPGEIDPVKSEGLTKYKKDVLTLQLVKKEMSTWAVMLSRNGLDQAPSE